MSSPPPSSWAASADPTCPLSPLFYPWARDQSGREDQHPNPYVGAPRLPEQRPHPSPWPPKNKEEESNHQSCFDTFSSGLSIVNTFCRTFSLMFAPAFATYDYKRGAIVDLDLRYWDVKDLGNTGGEHIGNRGNAERRTFALRYGLDSKIGESWDKTRLTCMAFTRCLVRA